MIFLFFFNKLLRNDLSKNVIMASRMWQNKNFCISHRRKYYKRNKIFPFYFLNRKSWIGFPSFVEMISICDVFFCIKALKKKNITKYLNRITSTIVIDNLLKKYIIVIVYTNIVFSSKRSSNIEYLIFMKHFHEYLIRELENLRIKYFIISYQM